MFMRIAGPDVGAVRIQMALELRNFPEIAIP